MQHQSVLQHLELKEPSQKSRKQTRCATSTKNSTRRKKSVTRNGSRDKNKPPAMVALPVVADAELNTTLRPVRKHQLDLAMTTGHTMSIQTHTLLTLYLHHQSDTMDDE